MNTIPYGMVACFMCNEKLTKSKYCSTCIKIYKKKKSIETQAIIKNEHNNNIINFQQQRRDFIKETNPNLYNQYKHSPSDYPFEFPEHLKSLGHFLITNNLKDTPAFKCHYRQARCKKQPEYSV